MDPKKLAGLIDFLRIEGLYLIEWADELGAGIEISSAEQLAQGLDIQAQLLTRWARSLRGQHNAHGFPTSIGGKSVEAQRLENTEENEGRGKQRAEEA